MQEIIYPNFRSRIVLKGSDGNLDSMYNEYHK